MKTNKKLIYIMGIVLAFALILIDQYTKALAVTALRGKEGIKMLGDALEFYYLENRGAAWGIMQDGTIFFAIISIIALAVIIFYYLYLPYTKQFAPIRVAFVFLASGAVGNLIDRLSNHYVIDFIYVKIIDFPVFNVADIYVTLSIAALAIIVLFKFKDEDLEYFKVKFK